MDNELVIRKDTEIEPVLNDRKMPFTYHLAADTEVKSFSYTAPAVKKHKGGAMKMCFLKIIPQDADLASIQAFEKEHRFRFSYPFIERVQGLYEFVLEGRRFSVLELDYIKGKTLDRVYYYDKGSVKRFFVQLGDSGGDQTEGQELSNGELMTLLKKNRTFGSVRAAWRKNIINELKSIHINLSFSPRFLEVMFRDMFQVLKAVDYYQTCETQCFSHRDIKPLNIFATYLRAVLFDFDRAHLRGDQTFYDYLRGTAGYYDPICAQYLGRSFTEEEQKKIDLYSLGMTFFYMIFGIRYFSDTQVKKYCAEGMEDLAYNMDFSTEQEQISTEKSLVITSYLLSDSKFDGLREILKKMTTGMEDRYKDAGEVLKDLKNYLNDYYKSDKDREKRLQFITEDPSLLNIERDKREAENRFWVSYEFYSPAGLPQRSSRILSYGNTRTIMHYGEPAMVVTCLQDRVEYVILNRDIRPADGRTDCIIDGSRSFTGKDPKGSEYTFSVSADYYEE